MREAINLIENFKVEKETNKIHYEVGVEIKNTIKKFEGTMHENLTQPDKNKKELDETCDIINIRVDLNEVLRK